MKIDRLVSIIMVLLEREKISAKELAERFEVSPRTIDRDVEAINQAGIPVLSTPGVGGGFAVLPQYKLDKKVFSATDLSAILMGLSSLSTIVRGDELANALAKVESFIPADRAKDIALRASQILIDPTPWQGGRSVQAELETIQAAIRDRRLLAFRYVDQRGSQTARKAEPYRLVLKNGQWYWQGYCRTREDFRLFKLSRMSGARVLDETFAPRPYPAPTFADAPQSPPTTVTLRIHRSVMDRALDYCAFEDFTPDGGAWYVVRLPFADNDYGYDFLLGFGGGCECLAPESVRAELKRRALQIAALYVTEPPCAPKSV